MALAVIKATTLALLLSSLVSLVTAQQGVLVNGNSQLPQCAQGCQALQQAASGCPGGTGSANQATWVCFCQSAFLTSLKTSSASTLCNTACTNPTDAQQIGTWYTTNCGSDFGASEHAGGTTGDAATTSAAAGPSSSSTAAGQATATPSSVAGGSDADSGNSNFSAGKTQSSGDWWSTHYKWIIMLIVLVICLPLLAFLAVCLKRRYDRKQDQINGGFNEGITQRAPGPMSDPHLNASGGAGSAAIDGSGRNSPARTRDAFMPYGYGYNRSESRLGSKQAVYDDRRSPLARGETPLDPEKEAGMDTAETPGKKKSKRVLVRERSVEDGIQSEKR
ncbi:hypothetical protein M409DRAFT_29535 [Zasmidium cellare ATCC 36951]|uniref:Extracellular membrane protein CFEM domain-containing protein n=1 Tax=Zasmidium cellare ATCC 36951 TaxID=1080233 RepID=A0A6A6C3F7_ZASCE|nr:uncharacterized protein M409DRAFT_29535 [Zasmidium cellare ATCC 36951]KAF2159926.1 hypothetical protein M409DRAFT_29535 [Zasmidium cellare ATCC 36951]